MFRAEGGRNGKGVVEHRVKGLRGEYYGSVETNIFHKGARREKEDSAAAADRPGRRILVANELGSAPVCNRKFKSVVLRDAIGARGCNETGLMSFPPTADVIVKTRGQSGSRSPATRGGTASKFPGP